MNRIIGFFALLIMLVSAMITCSAVHQQASNSVDIRETYVSSARASDVGKCHHKIRFVEEKPAGCTNDGEKAHYECKICFENFKDKDGKEPIDNPADLVVKALGHDWGISIILEPATCSKEGRLSKTCTRCNVSEDEKIPPTEHEFSSEDSSINLIADTATMLYKCKNCKATYKETVKPVVEVVKPASTKEDGLANCKAYFKFLGDSNPPVEFNNVEIPAVKTIKLKTKEVVYTGKKINPNDLELIVKDKNGNQLPSVDYELTVSSYKIGTATATLKLGGKREEPRYRDDPVQLSFSIIPQPVSGLKATPGDKAITLKWKPVTGADKYTVTYQVDGAKKKEAVALNEKSIKIAQNTVTANVKDLDQGKVYKFIVTAVAKDAVSKKDLKSETREIKAITKIGSLKPKYATKLEKSTGEYKHILSWEIKTDLDPDMITFDVVYGKKTLKGTPNCVKEAKNTQTWNFVFASDDSAAKWCSKKDVQYVVKAYYVNEDSERQLFTTGKTDSLTLHHWTYTSFQCSNPDCGKKDEVSKYTSLVFDKTEYKQGEPFKAKMILKADCKYHSCEVEYDNEAVMRAIGKTSEECTAQPGTYNFHFNSYGLTASYNVSPLAKPKNLTGKAVDENTVKLKWTSVDYAAGYEISYKQGNKTVTKYVKDVTYKVTKLKSKTKYTFSVRPYIEVQKKLVLGDNYATVVVPTKDASKKQLAPPENANYSYDSKTKELIIFWDKVDGADKYIVVLKDSSGEQVCRDFETKLKWRYNINNPGKYTAYIYAYANKGGIKSKSASVEILIKK